MYFKVVLIALFLFLMSCQENTKPFITGSQLHFLAQNNVGSIPLIMEEKGIDTIWSIVGSSNCRIKKTIL